MRILKLWVCVFVTVLFAACSQSQNMDSSLRTSKQDIAIWMEDNGKIKVLSSVRMIDDLVEQIGGDRVDRWTLIHGEIDPHSYEMVKGDDEKIGFAQIIFYNGLGLEHGASLSYRLQHHPHAVALAEKIRNLHPEKMLTRGGLIDPHIWMDISLWKEGIDPIVEALSTIAPHDAAYFHKNGEELKNRMIAVHEEIEHMMHSIPEDKRFLVTSHDAFHYFARVYLAESEELQAKTWHKRFIAPEGLAPEGQISPADIQEVIDYLLYHRVRMIFSESNVSRDVLRKIVDACGKKNLQIQIAPSCLHSDAMGPKGSETGSYLGMMRHNAKTMVNAWKASKDDYE